MFTSTTMLRPVDQTYLAEHFTFEVATDGGMVCVTIQGFPLVTGLTPATSDLLLRLPAGFPDTSPDMFWFATPVSRTDGRGIPATQVTESYFGRSWQRWSRHIGAHWRSGTDDVRSYVAYVRACLVQATT